VIPFGFNSEVPEEDELKVIAHMARMNTDLGCIKTVHIKKTDLLNSERLKVIK